MRKMSARLKRQFNQGFSLMEVVVALFVMSIGMLGMAGLTASSGANNKISQIKSTSLMLVNDYADRARANSVAFDAGNYSRSTPYAYTTALLTVSGCDSIATPCTASDIAVLDQNQWINTVRRRLPGGDVFVQTASTKGFVDNTAWRSMDVWVMWAEAEQASEFDFNSLDINNLLGGAKIFPCPAAAVAPANVRCMYFRVAI